MDSLKRMNDALGYIEEHLQDPINYQEVAKIAHCSEYHFKRMFSFLSGIGLSEYVRRRRLSLAALELKNTQFRILDIAVKYGYDSADSFTRAFQAMHGILPSQARDGNFQFKSYPRMSFQLTIKGADEMNYRILEKEAFHLIGFKKRVPIVFEGVNPDIADMTALLTPEIVAELKGLSDSEPQGIISASANFSEGRMEEKGELDHYIGVASTTKGAEKFDVMPVRASTWAVFEAKGPFPKTLQSVWGRIYSEWFPSSGYEAAEGPEILLNESPETSLPEYRSEIWVPVKKA